MEGEVEQTDLRVVDQSENKARDPPLRFHFGFASFFSVCEREISWWGMSFRFKDFKFFNNLLVLNVNVELYFNC